MWDIFCNDPFFAQQVTQNGFGELEGTLTCKACRISHGTAQYVPLETIGTCQGLTLWAFVNFILHEHLRQ